MINTNDINLYTPFYGELANDPYRYAFEQSEITAAQTISYIYLNNFQNTTTDEFYAQALFPNSIARIAEDHYLISNKLEKNVILREYICTHSDNKIKASAYNNYSLIYNNNKVFDYIQLISDTSIGLVHLH